MPRPDGAGSAARQGDGPLPRVLVVGCGALGRELVTLTRGLPGVDVTCLPAELHNRPERIPAAVADRIRARGGDYERVFVAYADCGTGGRLDAVLETDFAGIERIPGAHCYEFYAGAATFAALQDDEPGTFYLTDFLARQFERIVLRGLGLDRHPELLPLYFGNYRRLVYLAQTEDPDLVTRARAAADRLGLAFELRRTGLGELGEAMAPARAAADPVPGAAGPLPGAAGPLPGAAGPLPVAADIAHSDVPGAGRRQRDEATVLSGPSSLPAMPRLDWGHKTSSDPGSQTHGRERARHLSVTAIPGDPVQDPGDRNRRPTPRGRAAAGSGA